MAATDAPVPYAEAKCSTKLVRQTRANLSATKQRSFQSPAELQI